MAGIKPYFWIQAASPADFFGMRIFFQAQQETRNAPPGELPSRNGAAPRRTITDQVKRRNPRPLVRCSATPAGAELSVHRADHAWCNIITSKAAQKRTRHKLVIFHIVNCVTIFFIDGKCLKMLGGSQTQSDTIRDTRI